MAENIVVPEHHLLNSYVSKKVYLLEVSFDNTGMIGYPVKHFKKYTCINCHEPSGDTYYCENCYETVVCCHAKGQYKCPYTCYFKIFKTENNNIIHFLSLFCKLHNNFSEIVDQKKRYIESKYRVGDKLKINSIDSHVEHLFTFKVNQYDQNNYVSNHVANNTSNNVQNHAANNVQNHVANNASNNVQNHVANNVQNNHTTESKKFKKGKVDKSEVKVEEISEIDPELKPESELKQEPVSELKQDPKQEPVSELKQDPAPKLKLEQEPVSEIKQDPVSVVEKNQLTEAEIKDQYEQQFYQQYGHPGMYQYSMQAQYYNQAHQYIPDHNMHVGNYEMSYPVLNFNDIQYFIREISRLQHMINSLYHKIYVMEEAQKQKL